MTVKLENLTDRPVLLTLSSGEVLRLSPGETSDDLEDVEVRSSSKIEKLVTQGVITVQEPRRTAKKRTAKKTEKASPQQSEEDDGKAKKASE